MSMSIGGQEASRTQVILLGALGTIFVGLLLYMFVFRGGGEQENSVPAPVPVTEAAAPAPEAESETEPAKPPKAKKGPIETSQVFASKDPFEPLVDESAGNSGDADATGNATGTVPTSSADQTSGTGLQESDDSQSVSGRKVKLLDVFTRNSATKARIEVDGTVHKVAQGEAFADNFQVVSISGECADVLYGDVQFSLCKGESIES